MAVCFVIQPFDGGPFDKRYDDTLDPAIRAADLDPYRVDRDHGSVIPIDDIQKGIKKSDICLADISTDNPNVWFEVGFAIASGKPVVLICSFERVKFPFDVQHRSIIRYKTESRTDLDKLASQVTERLKAAIEKNQEIATIEELSPIANADGLSAQEMVALVIISQNLEGSVSAHSVLQEMNYAGYRDIAVKLATRTLAKRQFITAAEDQDFGGNRFTVFDTTEAGYRWLEVNQGKLALRKESARSASILKNDVLPADPPIMGEEIPF